LVSHHLLPAVTLVLHAVRLLHANCYLPPIRPAPTKAFWQSGSYDIRLSSGRVVTLVVALDFTAPSAFLKSPSREDVVYPRECVSKFWQALLYAYHNRSADGLQNSARATLQEV
jgi:hypothetical protein